MNKEKDTFEHFVSHSAANRLKNYHIILNVISYNCIEFNKNCLNIYTVINILRRNTDFSASLFILTGENFTSKLNYTFGLTRDIFFEHRETCK